MAHVNGKISHLVVSISKNENWSFCRPQAYIHSLSKAYDIIKLQLKWLIAVETLIFNDGVILPFECVVA